MTKLHKLNNKQTKNTVPSASSRSGRAETTNPLPSATQWLTVDGVSVPRMSIIMIYFLYRSVKTFVCLRLANPSAVSMNTCKAFYSEVNSVSVKPIPEQSRRVMAFAPSQSCPLDPTFGIHSHYKTLDTANPVIF